MITIIKYTENLKNIWDDFCKKSKKSLFMFERDYMEYHKDRFEDHSLLFYDDNELIAILPLTKKDDVLVSHGGLTYGGFIVGEKIKQHSMNECFKVLIDYCKSISISKIVYKIIPHIFHNNSAEEDKYALFINNAKILKIEPSTVVDLTNPFKMPKGRKSQISRAKREGIIVEKSVLKEDYDTFIALENEVLSEHHDTKAVHTSDEMYYLFEKFPSNIHLYIAKKDEQVIAGTVIYEYENVIHTQYMAANDEARRIGALDLTIATVIEEYKDFKRYLDFGISSEEGGLVLNEGLISQKEGFGGRTNVYETYVIDTAYQ